MAKTINHNNVMHPNPGRDQEGYHYFLFPCRGCMVGERKKLLWEHWLSSMSDRLNRETDNSWMMLVEEPENRYDPNAVAVVCKGEAYGTMGYVGKEYTAEIKAILSQCSKYRLDPAEEITEVQGQVQLLLTWK